MKHKAALVILFLTVLSLCACRISSPEPLYNQPVSPSSSSSQDDDSLISAFSLPYDPADTFNPYTCSTLQNYQITQLLFEPLVCLSETYEVRYRLAQEISLSSDLCVIRLKDGLIFSDGSSVTASDVRYSILFAAANERYSASLSSVSDVTIGSDNSVVITLSQPDTLFPRSLTFPIIKEGTGDSAIPIGCGRFVFSQSGSYLLPNQNIPDPVTNIAHISLCEASDLSAQLSELSSGNLSLFFSDMRSSLDPGIGITRGSVPLNNLVYVGINDRLLLFSSELRYVLSRIIPRQKIASLAYSGFASAVKTIINPADSLVIPTVINDSAQSDLDAALDMCGLSERDSEGFRIYKDTRFSLTLLVSNASPLRLEAANLIKEAFASSGLELTVVPLSPDSLSERLSSGKYELYLGEVKLSDNMNLLDFLKPSSLGIGVGDYSELIDAYFAAKSGEGSFQTFSLLFETAQPVFPVCFRCGAVYVSGDFSANIVATERDIFYNIEDW